MNPEINDTCNDALSHASRSRNFDWSMGPSSSCLFWTFLFRTSEVGLVHIMPNCSLPCAMQGSCKRQRISLRHLRIPSTTLHMFVYTWTASMRKCIIYFTTCCVNPPWLQHGSVRFVIFRDYTKLTAIKVCCNHVKIIGGTFHCWPFPVCT